MKQWQNYGPPPTERIDATHQRCPVCKAAFHDADFAAHYLSSHVMTVQEEKAAVASALDILIKNGSVKGHL